MIDIFSKEVKEVKEGLIFNLPEGRAVVVSQGIKNKRYKVVLFNGKVIERLRIFKTIKNWEGV